MSDFSPEINFWRKTWSKFPYLRQRVWLGRKFFQWRKFYRLTVQKLSKSGQNFAAQQNKILKDNTL
tara:strand:- start:564 stop:761 length:198 start_codon:yes stop_codon:yes gene_type:complete